MKTMNRKNALRGLCFSCLLALTLTGCSTVSALFVPGKTIADLRLRADIYKNVKLCEMACYGTENGRGLSWWNNPATANIIFADTQILEPQQGPNSPWKERWIIRRRGVLASYTLSFSPSPQGGTDFNVSFPPELK